MNPGLAVERIDREAGIVGKGGQSGRLGRGLRLDARVVAKRHSGLVRFRQPKFARRYGVDAVRRKQFAHFGELAGIMRRDNQTAGDTAVRGLDHTAPHITAIFCRSTSLATPLRASANSAANCSSENGVFLRGRLHLDDIAGAGEDEIGVGVGLRILGIVEIEHRHARTDAAGNRRDMIAQHVGLDHLARFHPGEAVVERDPGAGDGGGAGAAVGLDDVAVDGDLPLAERLEIDHRTQAAPDQALDFHGAAVLLAGRGLAPRALERRARQHAVFGGDPAARLAFEPRRQAIFQRRRDQHVGVAEFHEAGAFGDISPRRARARRGAVRQVVGGSAACRSPGCRAQGAGGHTLVVGRMMPDKGKPVFG